MNPKLPVVSGRQVVRALERVGYRVVRQRGSHIRLRDEEEEPEDAILAASAVLQRLVAQARQEPASSDWEEEYDD